MSSLPENLILKQMEIGPAGNFMYLIGDAKTKEIAVVDPAWEAQEILSEAQKDDLKITAVLLTHGHMDHVNALEDVLAQCDVPVYISKHEAPYYTPDHKNIVQTDDRQKIMIGSIEIECLWTPGHTPGCQCFKYKNVLITGDVLFIDGCGRCDLAGGDAGEMYTTLYEKILKLPEDTLLFTGHHYGANPVATLGEQRKTNPYLRCKSKSEFLQERMGIFS
jgi:glyoxylase-like metal-dependent hydrolase (beta-lactamase superfamily II)